MDGELGRYSFATHEIHREQKVVYSTVGELFVPLRGNEQYRTIGFREIAMIYGSTESSFRKTAELINRVRHQEGATPQRTLKDNTEAEGSRLREFMTHKAGEILVQNGFTPAGTPLATTAGSAGYGHEEQWIPEEKVEEAILKCRVSTEDLEMIRSNAVPYELPDGTVNVSIDDVCSKKQKEERRGPDDLDRQDRQEEPERHAETKKYIYNTVAHVHHGRSSYVLTGSGNATVLTMVIAVLINSGLLGLRMQFFADGQRTLHAAILRAFSWHKSIGLILDWVHLKKKCQEMLSMAMKGRQLRNEAVKQLLPLLWYGLTDKAIAHLKGMDPTFIRDPAKIAALIGYIDRNRASIPSYAVRKLLGLRNSSNRVEKMNDIVVSDRQKHNGMSWSESGSAALASITALKRNKEYARWFRVGDLEMKLAA